MKKLLIITALAVSCSLMAPAGSGCSAVPTCQPPSALVCTPNNGRCSVFVALGSTDYGVCYNNYSQSFCNKYDQYGGLLASNTGTCICF